MSGAFFIATAFTQDPPSALTAVYSKFTQLHNRKSPTMIASRQDRRLGRVKRLNVDLRFGLRDGMQSGSAANGKKSVIEAIHSIQPISMTLIGRCFRLPTTPEIAGITCAKESVYATVGALCPYFDLPNPASICCDKFIQRQLRTEAGAPVRDRRRALMQFATESLLMLENIGETYITTRLVRLLSARRLIVSKRQSELRLSTS
ncbi:hypothetical protein [Mesorhizobium sp. YC-39]|uniref:hypothetical protein n=1 Tax=unclassified Mesorhizobium TaxID=325217 RepID=UPI003991104C